MNTRNRTYYDNGRYYARAYRGYYYHGYRYYGYVPGYYYAPGFYGWAYNPWSAPIAYGWGWGGSPWYGAYGYYFSPYATYPSASFWLTDYLLAQNLQAAYEAQQDAASLPRLRTSTRDSGGGGGGNGRLALTPEVKQAIADEVAAQIAAEKNPAGNQGGCWRRRSDARRTRSRSSHFRRGHALSRAEPDGTGCSLSPGDVIRRIDDTPDATKT